MKVETAFERNSIKNIKKLFTNLFPNKIVIELKNDPDCIQGIPDRQISIGKTVAWLEYKRSEHEDHRPNQDYYIDNINRSGGFARFIYPENEQQVIRDLINYFNEKEKH